MVGKENNHIIQIVNGNFSPFEADDLLDELVRSRVNHHKIQMLRIWEGNHRFDSKDLDKKMEAIIREKGEANALLAKAKIENLKVEIIGNIEVRLTK